MVNENFYRHSFYIDSQDNRYISAFPSELGHMVAIKYHPMEYAEEFEVWNASRFDLGILEIVEGKKRFRDVSGSSMGNLVDMFFLIQEKLIQFYQPNFQIEESFHEYGADMYRVFKHPSGLDVIEFKDFMGRNILLVETSLWPIVQHKMAQLAEIAILDLFPDEERV